MTEPAGAGPDSLRLCGRVALVCGASSGIGLAIARRLRAEGAEVWGLARSERRLRAAGLDGFLVCDLERLELPELPPATILVNNTGGPPAGPLLEATPADFGRAFRRHLMAAHLLVQRLLPGMVAAGWGRILNVVSTSVREPIPGLGVSNTIRGAVAGWAKSLARELPPGITINNLLPGYTATERLAELRAATAARRGTSEEEVEREWLAEIPEGRLARPEEMAAAAAFLVSPEAAYLRGQSLAVDGGRMRSI
ncbi:MAG: SDR family oxidoreductase [Planctomycetota bacterium]|nr:MAG: SDR family oxidoreductase [Planctomycetota bacterium]